MAVGRLWDRRRWIAGAAVVILTGGGLFAAGNVLFAQGRSLQTPPVPITLMDAFDVPAADGQTEAIVAAAEAFLVTLTSEQREAALYPFEDNSQRSNWSNFPDGPVKRGGVMLGDLTEEQRLALDGLLAATLSEDGLNNVRYQLAAEDVVAAQDDDDGGGPGANFGSDFYYASFLGEPSTTEPWMMQFGGHHLAINATVFGPDVSFSPMLTGGEPLRITYEGQPIYITGQETAAAKALLDSLDETQREAAVRGDEPINLVLGPGEFGVSIAPEGVKGSNLSDTQRALLLDVVRARLGFVNDDDLAGKMAAIEAAIEDTHFAWWGPAEPLGAAYYRVTAPTVVIEYAPQDMDGDPTDHAHNMYRDPTNDYGVAWIGAQ